MGLKTIVCCFVFVLICVGIGIGVWFHLKKEDFFQTTLKRCQSYEVSRGLYLRNKDCPKITEAFKKAFVSKDPCYITWEDYRPLMELVEQTVPCDKILLWSRTKELAEEYQKKHKKDLLLIRDTLLGHIADEQTWCGKQNSSEIYTKPCPDKSTCKNNPVNVFWEVTSKWFAERACGVVNVLLNGSISKAFSENSIFRSVEVPNLKTGKVSKLQAWVIHNQEGAASDSCSGSVSELAEIIHGKGIGYTCKDVQSLDQVYA